MVISKRCKYNEHPNVLVTTVYLNVNMVVSKEKTASDPSNKEKKERRKALEVLITSTAYDHNMSTIMKSTHHLTTITFGLGRIPYIFSTLNKQDAPHSTRQRIPLS